MDQIRLGRTGLNVSVASLGAGGASRLGRSYGSSVEEAAAVVRTALDNGVNFVDTAAGYGTEDAVGVAIKGRRDEVVLSTKNWVVENNSSPDSPYITGAAFAQRVDESLTRLGTDYVEVMYVHGLHPKHYDYCVAEIVPVLERCREQGKIGHLGLSERFEFDTDHQMLSRAVVDDLFDVMMIGLNVINHSALRAILPTAAKNGVGVQAMFAVRGRLATVESAKTVVDEAIAAGEVDPADVDEENPLDFLTAPGVADSLAEACYRYCRYATGVHSVLTGTGNVGHLLENLRSINGPPLPATTIGEIEGKFGRVRSVTAN